MTAALATPPTRTAPKLDRATFQTSRLLDFCSEKELIAQTGHKIDDWPLVILKELVDNALDACEHAEVPPEIAITVDSDSITVSDNGPGIPADTVAGVLDFSIRVSSREAYVAPDRGAQGNALMTLVAMPFVLDGDEGHIEIVSQGTRHSIDVRVDPIRQTPVIDHNTKTGKSKKGTTVAIHWPERASCKLADAKDGFLRFADDFTFLNPHLMLSIDWFGNKTKTEATTPAWPKWRPCNPSPPHWYSRAHLERLIAAYIAYDDDGDSESRTVWDFISECRGLSGSAKRKKILEATGMARLTLADMTRKDGALDSEQVGQLLSAMKQNCRPVKPPALGIIGRDHLEQRFEAAGCVMDSFDYRKVAGVDDDIPWLIETAFAAFEDDAPRPRRLVSGVNWSPGIVNPFRRLGEYGRSLDTVLGQQECGIDEPILLLLHMTCPRVEYTDRGKSAVVIRGANDE
jgi:DNA topoisomerase VI subunit B